MALAFAADNTSGVPLPAVSLPKKLDVDMFAILESVTAPAAMVVAKDPVPLPVTSLVRVIVWSPVFVPLEVPECEPEKLDAEIAPENVPDPDEVKLPFIRT